MGYNNHNVYTHMCRYVYIHVHIEANTDICVLHTEKYIGTHVHTHRHYQHKILLNGPVNIWSVCGHYSIPGFNTTFECSIRVFWSVIFFVQPCTHAHIHTHTHIHINTQTWATGCIAQCYSMIIANTRQSTTRRRRIVTTSVLFFEWCTTTSSAFWNILPLTPASINYIQNYKLSSISHADIVGITLLHMYNVTNKLV